MHLDNVEDKNVDLLLTEKENIKMSEAACDYLNDGDWKSAASLFHALTEQGDTYGSALLNSNDASERKKGAEYLLNAARDRHSIYTTFRIY